MATYKRSEDIINIGAYARGSNMKLDQAIQLKDTIDKFLKQSIHEKFTEAETLASLMAISSKIRS